MKKIVKTLFIVLGFVSLGLGLVGVALPVLPTTPFLIVTAFCFARGSERFHRWFTGTGLYRRHLESFVEKRAMRARSKAFVLVMVSVLLPLAMYFAPWLHARIAMGAVLAWHWWYFLFRVKTLKAGGDAGGEAGGEHTGAEAGGGIGAEAVAEAGGGDAGERAR
ncbi:MAG: YbaN family protein [Clostridiales Family XIII bacterium]|nr:YbaN family protein [Clostridiales Family XIII bacterium]